MRARECCAYHEIGTSRFTISAAPPTKYAPLGSQGAASVTTVHNMLRLPHIKIHTRTPAKAFCNERISKDTTSRSSTVTCHEPWQHDAPCPQVMQHPCTKCTKSALLSGDDCMVEQRAWLSRLKLASFCASSGSGRCRDHLRGAFCLWPGLDGSAFWWSTFSRRAELAQGHCKEFGNVCLTPVVLYIGGVTGAVLFFTNSLVENYVRAMYTCGKIATRLRIGDLWS